MLQVIDGTARLILGIVVLHRFSVRSAEGSLDLRFRDDRKHRH